MLSEGFLSSISEPIVRMREICKAVALPKVRSSRPLSLAFCRVDANCMRWSVSESMTLGSSFLRSIFRSSARMGENSRAVPASEDLRVPAIARSSED